MIRTIDQWVQEYAALITPFAVELSVSLAVAVLVVVGVFWALRFDQDSAASVAVGGAVLAVGWWVIPLVLGLGLVAGIPILTGFGLGKAGFYCWRKLKKKKIHKSNLPRAKIYEQYK